MTTTTFPGHKNFSIVGTVRPPAIRANISMRASLGYVKLTDHDEIHFLSGCGEDLGPKYHFRECCRSALGKRAGAAGPFSSFVFFKLLCHASSPESVSGPSR
jgi:hypothetical protein